MTNDDSRFTFWFGREGAELKAEYCAERYGDYIQRHHPHAHPMQVRIEGAVMRLPDQYAIMRADWYKPKAEPEPDDPAAESVAAALRAHGEEDG